MATIDLGKIKFVFRGTYASGTAYVPDDVVTFTDGSVTSSYICTTATTGNNPSSGGTAHGSWAFLAKGQATSPTTTQGDLIVRGASADERLAIGSAGQALKVNSSANGYEFGQAGMTLQSKYARTNSIISSSNNYGDKYYPNNFSSSDGTQILGVNITPLSNNSHFQIWYSGDHSTGGNATCAIALFHGTTRVTTTCINCYAGDNGGMSITAWIDTNGLSGSQSIQVRNMGSQGGHTHRVNADHSGNNKNTYCHLQVHEVAD
tara:strand:- start:3051 stop:3836 length:786 start_codon:yes stop_codon:yes gene_type:complete